MRHFILFGSLPRLQLSTRFSHYWEALKTVFFCKSWVDPLFIKKTEIQLAKIIGKRNVILTNMARLGIYLVLKNIIKPGQKVILSPYTISEVINMVICAGGIPVFADLDKNTCNISAEAIKKHLRMQKNIGAVMVTHFYGKMCDINQIKKLCIKAKIPLIEDTAQAFGAKCNSHFAGTFGTAGVLSFGIYKNINTFYGGAIVTDDNNLAKKIREEIENSKPLSKIFFIKKVISAFIIDIATNNIIFRIFTFNIYRIGYLLKIQKILNHFKTDLNPKAFYKLPKDYVFKPNICQAKLLPKQLQTLQAQTDERRRKAKIYIKGLEKIKTISIPATKELEGHAFWYFPLIFKRRDELVRHALIRGRDITPSYHRNCADLRCFEEFKRNCPEAKKTEKSVIYLPVYPKYSDREIYRNIETLKNYLLKKT